MRGYVKHSHLKWLYSVFDYPLVIEHNYFSNGLFMVTSHHLVGSDWNMTFIFTYIYIIIYLKSHYPVCVYIYTMFYYRVNNLIPLLRGIIPVNV